MNLIPQALAQTEQAPAPSAESPAPTPTPTPTPTPAPAPATPAQAPTAESPAPAASPTTPKTAAPSAAAPAPGKITIGAAAPAQQAAPVDPTMEMLQITAPFLVIVGIVYLVVLRPQQRAQKAAAAALRNVRRGDLVATSGGLIGKVTKSVDDNEVEVELAPNMRVRLLRSAITEVRAKGEPVKDAPTPPAKAPVKS